MSTEARIRPHKDMTPNDLKIWRGQQPGDYAWKNNQRKAGWSQVRAADWYGVSIRQWVRYESGENAMLLIPRVCDSRSRRAGGFCRSRDRREEWTGQIQAVGGSRHRGRLQTPYGLNRLQEMSRS